MNYSYKQHISRLGGLDEPPYVDRLYVGLSTTWHLPASSEELTQVVVVGVVVNYVIALLLPPFLETKEYFLMKLHTGYIMTLSSQLRFKVKVWPWPTLHAMLKIAKFKSTHCV